MEYFIGIIIGLLIAIIILLGLIYFQKPIEKEINLISKKITPRPKGFIIYPESEEEEARNEIIEKNRANGRDTRMEELL